MLNEYEALAFESLYSAKYCCLTASDSLLARYRSVSIKTVLGLPVAHFSQDDNGSKHQALLEALSGEKKPYDIMLFKRLDSYCLLYTSRCV